MATPHLDRLAAEGVWFERAYCTNPICTPSRASLMTGHHLPRHGVTRIDSPLGEHQVMFPQRLREIGYRTGLIGKLHAQSGGIEQQQRHPRDGFDVYDLYYGGGAMMDSPLNAYAPWVKARRPEVFERLRTHAKQAGAIPRDVHMNTWAAQRSEVFLDEAVEHPDQPFFLMVSVFDPHNPYNDHPPEAAGRVDPEQFPPLIPPPTDRAAWPNEVERHAADNYFGDFRAFTDQQIRDIRVGYHAEVGMIDDLVGQVRNQLASKGLLENTLVLFCSDHGDLLGDHGLMVKGGVPYDANIRIPTIVRFPENRLGIDSPEPGARYPSPIQLNDLTALMLRSAGLPSQTVARELPDAIDPSPALVDPQAPRRQVAINAYRNTGLARGHVPFDPPIHLTSAMDDRYTLALYHHPATGRETPTVYNGQLFDRHKDPDEQNDLYKASSHREVQARLTACIQEFLDAERQQLASPSG